MRVFDETDYKEVIKKRIAELKLLKSGFSFRQVALAVPMQYTFLSKVLNQEKAHLSEDQLYSINHILEFYADESEFVFLLRSAATTGNERRREELLAQVSTLRTKHSTIAVIQDHKHSDFNLAMRYLLEPEHLFVQLGLHITTYRKNPKMLCAPLGLSIQRLEQILIGLNKLGHIELGDTPFQIKKAHERPIHFGPDHPIMRVHQNLMRTLTSAQLLRTPEAHKKSFQALFAADPKAFQEIKIEFDRFIQRVQKIAVASPPKSIYELSLCAERSSAELTGCKSHQRKQCW